MEGRSLMSSPRLKRHWQNALIGLAFACNLLEGCHTISQKSKRKRVCCDATLTNSTFGNFRQLLRRKKHVLYTGKSFSIEGAPKMILTAYARVKCFRLRLRREREHTRQVNMYIVYSVCARLRYT